jgi:hypothetical protein
MGKRPFKGTVSRAKNTPKREKDSFSLNTRYCKLLCAPLYMSPPQAIIPDGRDIIRLLVALRTCTHRRGTFVNPKWDHLSTYPII